MHALQNDEMLFEANRHIPANDPARAFAQRHIRIIRAYQEIREEDLRERLPLLRQMWEEYVRGVPEFVREGMIGMQHRR